MSHRLPVLQQVFAHYLVRREGEATALIRGDEKADARERMDLYAGAYLARLVEVLEDHYPGLWGLVGDEQFRQLCRDYIAACPSSFRSIRHFGHRMAEFLEETSPYSSYPQLAEMARFEWAQGEVFDAANRDPVDETGLQAVPPEQWGLMSFDFIPAMRLLDLRWNVPPIWQALERGESPPEAGAREFPVAWLVWRQDLDPRWRPLEVDEAWALQRALAGDDFATLCEGLLEWVDVGDAPLRAATLLRSWLDNGLICAVNR